VGLLLVFGGLALLGYPLLFPSQPDDPEPESTHGSVGWVEENPVENQEEDEARDQRELVLEEWQSVRLVIPDIGLDLEPIYGDVFDDDLLQEAPVHFGMSDLPSTRSGNVAFAAHRRGNAAFFRELDRLEEGDFVYLEVADQLLVYRVAWNRIVEPDDWSVIDSTDYPALTLQTCEPKDSSATHRLIVRANFYKLLDGQNIP